MSRRGTMNDYDRFCESNLGLEGIIFSRCCPKVVYFLKLFDGKNIILSFFLKS
jgi:hypothetical protein